MKNSNKNYRLILYEASSICKNARVNHLIAQHYPQDKQKIVEAMNLSVATPP